MQPTTIQLERIRSTLAIQFPGIDLDQIAETIEVTVSRKTGRVRGIFDGDTEERLFSLRTSDGRFLPTYVGGTRLLSQGYRGNRIIMNSDAAPFVAKGKSAFCKHVVSVDGNVVPDGEVLLLDETGELLGVGTAQQPGYALKVLKSGVAAKVKHSRDK